MAYKPQTVAVIEGGTGVKYEINLGNYGDGSDGTQTFDGTTTILAMVPVANVYTLLRDMFLSTSSINNGVTIISNGFRLYCKGTLTNNGTIRWSGNDGTNTGVAGLSKYNSQSSININVGTSSPGTAGGTGTIASGINGVNNAASSLSFGGAGGKGGAGASGGGQRGTQVTILGPVGSMRDQAKILFTRATTSTVFSQLLGGTGGGGGGGDGVNVGGGGGSGGAIVVLIALYIAGTGTISANGGNGGAGAPAGTNCGGGGGGGGGIVLIISRSANNDVISGQTLTVTGGVGGAGVGLGVAGSNGVNGRTVVLSG